MVTGMISTEGMSSMITDSIVMIDVECSPLPQEVDRTRLDNRMTDASTVLGEGFQSTPENQASTRDPLSCKVWSTGTEPIEADSTEMRPQAVECMFLVLNVSAELSEPQLSLPISGWQQESASSLVSLSLKLGLKTTEWQFRLVVGTTR